MLYKYHSALSTGYHFLQKLYLASKLSFWLIFLISNSQGHSSTGLSGTLVWGLKLKYENISQTDYLKIMEPFFKPRINISKETFSRMEPAEPLGKW